MTCSLISSWNYIFNAYEGYEDEAYKSFLRTLRREPSEPTQAMQAGIDFEDAINAVVEGKAEPKTECIKKIAGIVSGGQPQVKLYKDIKIGGMDFLLYGRLDYLKSGTIYDIKFSKNYEVGKFYSSAQHPFYLTLCPESNRFEYLISDGNDVFIETYTRETAESTSKIISVFIQWLKDTGNIDTYVNKWGTIYE